jgi:hypothetical protein
VLFFASIWHVVAAAVAVADDRDIIIANPSPSKFKEDIKNVIHNTID